MSQQIKDLTAGAVGGVCITLLGHPLDTVKVRLQTMPVPKPGQSPVFNGTFDCVKKTFRHEGFFGFYKGMSTRMVAVAPHTALSVFGFGIGKEVVSYFRQTSADRLTMSELLLAGCFAPFCSVAILAPTERVKCLLQIQTRAKHKVYNGPLDCAKKLYVAGGMKSIYKGTLLTLIRGMVYNGIYFSSYEGIKRCLSPSDKSPSHFSVGKTLFAGGTAGVLGWTAAMCPDVLKSRYQTAPPGKYMGTFDVVRDVLKTEGVKGMYKGFSAVIIRAFPANAAFFLGCECTKKIFDHLAVEDQQCFGKTLNSVRV